MSNYAVITPSSKEDTDNSPAESAVRYDPFHYSDLTHCYRVHPTNSARTIIQSDLHIEAPLWHFRSILEDTENFGAQNRVSKYPKHLSE